jgi:hypothetical protein
MEKGQVNYSINKNTKAISDKAYILGLISLGENQQLDFKFEISDSRKLARTLTAFSNTDGGRLLIGVKDNGSIAGVRSEEEYHMVEAAAELYCKPPVDFVARKWLIDGKAILEINIQKSDKLHFANTDEKKWLVYVRVEDQNILANRVLFEVLKRKHKPFGTFVEYSKNENVLLNYLSENRIVSCSAFCKLAQIKRRDAEEILINLICLKVIQMHISEKGAVYSLL